jgi:hypothetical protein
MVQYQYMIEQNRSETWHIILSAKAAVKRSVLLFVMTMESITIIAMRAKSKSMKL